MRTAQAESVTKQELLAAAQELMLTKGYTASSVDEVCTLAGLTKGSFFHYFESKEDLGMALAERFHAAMREGIQSAPFLQMSDPLDRVLGYVDLLIAKSHNPRLARGCLLGTFVQELSETHPKIRDACAACFDEQADWLTAELEEAKARHTPHATWSSRSVAEHLIAVAQGALILAKAQCDAKVFEESLEHYKEYLRSICERR